MTNDARPPMKQERSVVRAGLGCLCLMLSFLCYVLAVVSFFFGLMSAVSIAVNGIPGLASYAGKTIMNLTCGLIAFGPIGFLLGRMFARASRAMEDSGPTFLTTQPTDPAQRPADGTPHSDQGPPRPNS